MALYTFHEPMTAFNEKNMPYGLWMEKSSVYTHNHVRRENDIFYISCAGNKFLFATPDLAAFRAKISFGFHYVEGISCFRFVFGYDMDFRRGHALIFRFGKNSVVIELERIDARSGESIARLEKETDLQTDALLLNVRVSDGAVSGDIGGTAFGFALPDDYVKGRLGIALISSVGEMAVRDIAVESDDGIECEVLEKETTVDLSLRSGGTMPYTLCYSVVRCGGVTCLRYRFDGGEQYRERYPYYPRRTGQYSAERHVFVKPYIALLDGETSERLGRFFLYSGRFTVTDPGLAWKVLLRYFNVVHLPLTGDLPLTGELDFGKVRIAFGYERQQARGYNMQRGLDIEEVFDFRTGKPVSVGTSAEKEHIEIASESENTARLIPRSVYGYDTVLEHLKKNHFFDSTETIRFTVRFITKKIARFIRLKAVLCDVFGDPLDEMLTEADGCAARFTHAPLKVGVYRIRVTACYGDTEMMTREVTFEVYDRTGKKCAPLESGLPVLFSMPNEQKYLDRDAFDLYNPAPDCNSEHYYSVSGMPGDVGMRKRIWETNRLFGRKWYVWDSFHRTLTREEFAKYGSDLIRYSDYCYYPVPHEWAVMRHDPLSPMGFYNNSDNPAGLNGDGIIDYLHDFLALHPEIDIGLAREDRHIKKAQLDKLLSLCLHEWLDYANKRVNEDFRKNTAWMRSVNPAIKRACYGPFNLYGGTMATHYGCKYIGYDPEGSLAEYMFDGFGQLEDYPYSCTYHTYQGAFFVANALLHHEGLKIYPEEYTASEGGCIDGAVKDAHPPLGRYDMQPYFNVTHSYEYVYNTAHLTGDGFRYWKDRGFMQRDFTEEFVDAFVRGWKNVLRHEPSRPLRAPAYLSEIPSEEDNWNTALSCISNQSNGGLGYVFETSRLAGLPNGFTVTYDTLMQLTPAMTDCVVLPSLKGAPGSAKAKLRELYEAGVALIAVSAVDGLEDLFGVEACKAESEICRLKTDAEAGNAREERIFPNRAEFAYKANGAGVLLWAAGREGAFPAMFAHGRTLLLNANLDKLGCQSYGIRSANFYAANISALVRETLLRSMKALLAPTAAAVSDGCGVTLLKDEKGNTLLLVIDYSDYDLADPDRTWTYTVSIRLNGITDVEPVYGDKPILLKEDGAVRGISFSLHQQECALYILKGIE